jgi:hypothetical protein
LDQTQKAVGFRAGGFFVGARIACIFRRRRFVFSEGAERGSPYENFFRARDGRRGIRAGLP